MCVARGGGVGGGGEEVGREAFQTEETAQANAWSPLRQLQKSGCDRRVRLGGKPAGATALTALHTRLI